MNRPGGINPLTLWVLVALATITPALLLGQQGTLQGRVWHDENANGLRDAHESPLAGRVIELQDGQRQVTQADGYYAFSELPAGPYTLSQVSPSDWRQSYPLSDISFGEQLTRTQLLTADTQGQTQILALAGDGRGGTYLGGTFSGTVDLDPGAGLDLHTENGTGVFVVKLDDQGGFAWSRAASVGAAGRLAAVVQDANGIYVIGHFQAPAFTFGGDAVDGAVANPGFYSLFVTHFKADGRPGWTRVLGGPGSMTLGNDLAVDGQGGLYLTGSFNQTVDFDPGPGTRNLQARGDEMFLVKLGAADGQLKWVRASRGLTQARGLCLGSDPLQGHVYLTGAFRTYIDLNWGDGQAHLQSHGDWDTFTASVTGEGSLRWARTISGSYSILPYDSAVDGAGNLYVAGMYTGSVDFDPGMGQDLRHYSYEAMGQAYLWKLDAAGDYQWTRTHGTEQEGTAGTGVAVDTMGRVYWVGESTAAYHDPNRVSHSDLFLTAYSEQGQLLSDGSLKDLVPADVLDTWLYSFTPRTWRVAVQPGGALDVTGPVRGCADLDPGPGDLFHCSASGASDAFLLRFGGSPEAAAWTVNLEPGQVVQGLDFASYPQGEADD
jgi:hypothetical protein